MSASIRAHSCSRPSSLTALLPATVNRLRQGRHLRQADRLTKRLYRGNRGLKPSQRSALPSSRLTSQTLGQANAGLSLAKLGGEGIQAQRPAAELARGVRIVGSRVHSHGIERCPASRVPQTLRWFDLDLSRITAGSRIPGNGRFQEVTKDHEAAPFEFRRAPEEPTGHLRKRHRDVSGP